MQETADLSTVALIIFWLLSCIPWWILVYRTGLPAHLHIFVPIPLLNLYPTIRVLFLRWPVNETADQRDRRVRELEAKVLELETVCNRPCPTCGTPLRKVQVDHMIGNPSYSLWAREGYCSAVCREKAGTAPA